MFASGTKQNECRTRRGAFLHCTLLTILIITTCFISCDAPRNNPLDPYSDTRPVIENFLVYSIVRNKYPTLQTYQVIIETKIKDSNSIIDSVLVENSYLEIRKPLEFNFRTDKYERTFNLNDLNTAEIDEVVGHDFHIMMKDYSFNEFDLGVNDLKRIIKEELRIESPIGSDTVAAAPQLKWRRFSGKFSFNYKVQVFTADITPELIYERDGISSDSTTHTIDTPLQPRDYFWIIWCKDQFNNMGSSKPATFTVNQ